MSSGWDYADRLLPGWVSELTVVGHNLTLDQWSGKSDSIFDSAHASQAHFLDQEQRKERNWI